MMRAVFHPNILSILELYEGDNNIYCLGTYYEGECLSQVIKDKKIKISKDIVLTCGYKLIRVKVT